MEIVEGVGGCGGCRGSDGWEGLWQAWRTCRVGNKGVGLHGAEGSGTPKGGCTSHGRCGGTEGAEGAEGVHAAGGLRITDTRVLKNYPRPHGAIIGARSVPDAHEVRA